MTSFPIAVVGIGCRLAGLRGPDEFWAALREGRDLLSGIPKGGSPDRIEEFDAGFFGLSPREAVRLDPRHRLWLQTAREAVEDAGLTLKDLAGSRTGLYTAQSATQPRNEPLPADIRDIHPLIRIEGRSSLPARLACLLDLRGPAVAVDATRSCALLAVHMACQGLRLGDIDAAVVGGADGGAAVVLKPLERALEHGDRIYSVVLGSAATNDGDSNPPSRTLGEEGQRRLLRAAYTAADASPRDVVYVEAHGTGTQVGDRAELTALGAELGAGRGGRDRLLVGSVTSNLGRTESASGLAGLIKVALSLRHGEIPGLAGVSSFGIGGSNVHLVLSAPPEPDSESKEQAPHIPPAAARTGDAAELAAAASPTVVYVFPGLGARWADLARALLAECPPFAEAMREYDAAVRDAAGWSVVDLLDSHDPLTDVGLAGPAGWAVQCALAAVWRRWGVWPAMAIGHGMGEVAAATVSGALTVSGAAAVVCLRSALLSRSGPGGGMTAVQLPSGRANALAERYGGRMAVAADESPTSCVLAADVEELCRLERRLTAEGIFWRRVNARFAAHGPAMDPLLDELRELLGDVRPVRGEFPIQSTVDCARSHGAGFDAAYWALNLRRPVRFREAVEAVLADGGRALFIEMGPHPLPTRAIQECIDEAAAPASVVSCPRRANPTLGGLLNALDQAHRQGARVDWGVVHS